MEDRKILEATFHDNREKLDTRHCCRKFYSITNLSQDYINNIVSSWKGKKILDYCCGTGEHAVELAKLGCDVVGIDISEEEIRIARNLAIEELGGGFATSLLVMLNIQDLKMKLLIV